MMVPGIRYRVMLDHRTHDVFTNTDMEYEQYLARVGLSYYHYPSCLLSTR